MHFSRPRGSLTAGAAVSGADCTEHMEVRHILCHRHGGSGRGCLQKAADTTKDFCNTQLLNGTTMNQQYGLLPYPPWAWFSWMPKDLKQWIITQGTFNLSSYHYFNLVLSLTFGRLLNLSDTVSTSAKWEQWQYLHLKALNGETKHTKCFA